MDNTTTPIPDSQEQKRAAPIAPAPTSIIFFGTSGAFSPPSLDALLRAGYQVRAIVVSALAGVTANDAPPFTILPATSPRRAGTRRALPLLAPPTSGSIHQIAAERDIPVLEVARLRDPRTLDALAAFDPDVICVACFSRRLPAAVLRLPRLGCLNVHPSLLPANRGPDPLFWTFRRGDPETGATIHLMDERLDTGPILRQQRIPVPEGITEQALEQTCATIGGELLVRAISDLASGEPHAVPQDERLATSYPWPQPEDYVITTDRPARWAYNFAAGLGHRSVPIVIRVSGAVFQVLAPIRYDTEVALRVPWRKDDDVLSVQCSPGVFTCRAAPLATAL